MGNKKFLFISLLILAIGFAAVSTTLYITGNVAYQTKKSNFDVYFSGAEIDNVDVSNEVIKDKKHIEYISNELKTKDDTSTLMYEVTNDSTEYDATVTISCTPMKTDYIEVSLIPETFDIDAGEIKSGEIEAKLIKVSETEQNISMDCELDVKAKERTSIETILGKNNNYAVSGIFKDNDGNPLSGENLVVYSNTPHEVTTDRNGYFYVDNLERGIHQIFLKTENVDVNDKEAVDESSSFYARISTNGFYEFVRGNYKITNIQTGLDITDDSYYCLDDWCDWVEFEGKKSSDYNNIDEVLNDTEYTSLLLANNDAMDYLANSTEISASIKENSNYKTVYVPLILNYSKVSDENNKKMFDNNLPAYLYLFGNEFSSVTGGWITVGASNGYAVVAHQKNADHLYTYAKYQSEEWYHGISSEWRTANDLDLTLYNYAYVNYNYVSNANAVMSAGFNDKFDYRGSPNYGISGSVNTEIDISSLEVSYGIVRTYSSYTNTTYGITRLYEEYIY